MSVARCARHYEAPLQLSWGVRHHPRISISRMDAALHDTLLAEVVRTPDAMHPEIAPLAARYQLIPLYLDWMGFIGLRTDGELLFVGLSWFSVNWSVGELA